MSASNQLCHQIVKANSFAPRVEEICKTIINKLTPHEVEYIAQSSFAYSSACESGEIMDRPNIRYGMAMIEVARYFDASKEDQDLTFDALKRTCNYRKEYRIDLLRSCLDAAAQYKSDEDAEIAERYRVIITKELPKQPMVVKSGSTGRGVLEIKARCSTDMDDEKLVLTAVYMIERAIAATESLSKGAETMMDVIFDASSYSSKYAPSRSALKKLAHITSNHYPQRLNLLVVLDCPFWLSTLYTLLSSFLDQRTRNKVQMARGSKARNSSVCKVLKFPGTLEEDAVKVASLTPFQAPADTLHQSSKFLRQ